jgi:hypothetical protein
MSLVRTLAIAMSLALAACAAPASQDPSTSHRLRTGGPNPPQRVEDTCKVDADCADKPHCEGVDCRCVETQCIAPREAIDPSIDPAPATSVR